MTPDRQVTTLNRLVTDRIWLQPPKSIYLTKRGFASLNVEGVGDSIDHKHKKWDKVLQFQDGKMFVKQF